MDPNSVSENNASAPIAPPEYRPTQSTLPKRTGIKLLIIVIVSGVALAAIGYILMGAGFVVFVIGLALMMRKRQSVTTVRSGVDADGVGVTERRTAVSPDVEA